MTYIPIAECKNGGLYRIHSRKLTADIQDLRKEDARGH